MGEIERCERLVRVYRNLNKKCFSVQEKIDGRWKVVCYADCVTLINPVFKVYESGRLKVLKENVKNVHAYVIGYLSFEEKEFEFKNIVSYDPYKFGYFYNKDLKPVLSAKVAKLRSPNLIYID